MQTLHKIISADQIRSCDTYTIENEPISSIDLMERASNAFVRSIKEELKPNMKVAVLCGPGNNGGDGLAIARILSWNGFEVYPFLYEISSTLSEDCMTNANKINALVRVKKGDELPDLEGYEVLIDGLFGSGLNRKIEGWAGLIIDSVNTAPGRKISIDIPSGMYCDAIPEGQHIVRSDVTISFQRPKLSFFFPESEPFVKEWRVVDIGLDESFLQSLPSTSYVLDDLVPKLVQDRPRFTHKGTYGHALIVAGARGKMGAAVLCGKGCLRSGVGLLTIHLPACGLDIVQTSVHEAMCSIDPHAYHFTGLPELDNYDSIGIGPGLGLLIETKEALAELMATSKLPLVLDADAINIVSNDNALQMQIPEQTILTPHPKEFERLVGTSYNSGERLEKQIEFSKKHRCIVVLKDAITVISDPEGRVYYNTTGNPGMATGGSGDVLTGIITGLLAQSYKPLEAAILGVYFHGKAGDAAAEMKGENAIIAGDLVEYLRIENKTAT